MDRSSSKSNINIPAPAAQVSVAGEEKPQVGLVERAVQERARKARLERNILISVVSIISIMGIAGWYTEGAIFSGAIEVMNSLKSGAKQSRQPELNCLRPENKFTPYCQERKSRIEQDWRSTTRSNGAPNQFSLHGKGK